MFEIEDLLDEVNEGNKTVDDEKKEQLKEYIKKLKNDNIEEK